MPCPCIETTAAPSAVWSTPCGRSDAAIKTLPYALLHVWQHYACHFIQMFWQKKSMATFGYARTSTRDQEAGLQAQIRDLIAAGCAERDIYTEQASSVRERPELDLLRRRILRPGDELVVTRLDRLARSARDTLALAEELGQRGVTLKILDPAMTIEPAGRANGSMGGAVKPTAP